jgi:hypothetical protein
LIAILFAQNSINGRPFCSPLIAEIRSKLSLINFRMCHVTLRGTAGGTGRMSSSIVISTRSGVVQATVHMLKNPTAPQINVDFPTRHVNTKSTRDQTGYTGQTHKIPFDSCAPTGIT